MVPQNYTYGIWDIIVALAGESFSTSRFQDLVNSDHKAIMTDPHIALYTEPTNLSTGLISCTDHSLSRQFTQESEGMDNKGTIWQRQVVLR